MALPSEVQQALDRIEQGPVEVAINPDTDNVKLLVNGGFSLSILHGLEEAPVDLLGVYDLRTSGDGGEFELNLFEQSMTVLSRILAEGRDGSSETPPYRGIGVTAGKSTRANAVEIQVRPWQTRSSNTVQVKLWKCVVSGDITHGIMTTEPASFTVPFRALPDATKSDGELIGRVYLPARS